MENQTLPQRPPAEAVSLTGKLIVAHGMSALQSGNDTYLVFGLSRLAGFIDGLREGAQVSIEGRAVTNPRNSEIKILLPSQLNLDGRTYDLGPPAGTFGPRGMYDHGRRHSPPGRGNPQR
jgi:hypothetical protein